MSEISLAKSRSGVLSGLRWGMEHPSLTLGGIIVALIVVCALFAPWLSHYDPYAQDLLNILSAPSADHWLGTDDYGRDIFSRTIYGARISLIEVVVSVALSLLMGLPLGIIAALCGKSVDHLIMVGDGCHFRFSRYRAGHPAGQRPRRRVDEYAAGDRYLLGAGLRAPQP